MTLISPRGPSRVRVLASQTDADLDYVFNDRDVTETVLAEPETVSEVPRFSRDLYDYRVPVTVDPVTEDISVSPVYSWCSTEPVVTLTEPEVEQFFDSPPVEVEQDFFTEEEFAEFLAGFRAGLAAPEVHFWHPHFTRTLRSSTESNRLTVAFCYFEDTGETAFGVSFCSPNDQFSRPLGREIAEHRLYEHPVCLDLQKGLGLRQVREAIVDILSGGVRHVFVPGLPHGRITVGHS